jgi:DNA topoisomerase-1
MERKGIGRPSTYAATLKTLKDRTYLSLQGKVLHPTELGLKTDEVLSRGLPELVSSEFTEAMERTLDAIAEGKQQWERYLIRWNQEYLQPQLAQARQLIRGQFQARPRGAFNNQNLGKSRTKCPECQKAMAKVPSKKVSKGHFLKCVNDCGDLVMFWSERQKQWEPPKSRPAESGNTFAPRQTGFSCPVCRQALEEYGYTKEGQAKSLLRCSNPKARMDKKHQDVVFFQAKGKWWSPKYGELKPEETI